MAVGAAGPPAEAPPVARPAALVIGSGPVRIGQGIEFDYCAVQAADVLRRNGWSAVMVNSNPETVSTDFDASTRLYFEPLDTESVRNIIDFESAGFRNPDGTVAMLPAVVAFGGQTPLNLAGPLVAAGVPLLGSDLEAIDQAEERTRFSALLDRLGIPQPEGGMAESIEEARAGLATIIRGGGAAARPEIEVLARICDGAGEAEARQRALEPREVAGERERDAVAHQQRVVLVGLQDLFAAAFAAHHQQAGICHDLGRRQHRPQARKQTCVELADQSRDAVDADAAAMHQPHHFVDALGRGTQLGQAGGVVDLQRHDVRVVGHEAHQVELAQHAHHPLAVAHDEPVHPVAHHQPQGLEEIGIGLHADQVELGHFAHRDLLRRRGQQQGVPQVGGGEDAQSLGAALAVAHQGLGQPVLRQGAADRNQVIRAFNVERLAQVDVADARRHQRQLRGH